MKPTMALKPLVIALAAIIEKARSDLHRSGQLPVRSVNL